MKGCVRARRMAGKVCLELLKHIHLINSAHALIDPLSSVSSAAKGGVLAGSEDIRWPQMRGEYRRSWNDILVSPFLRLPENLF